MSREVVFFGRKIDLDAMYFLFFPDMGIMEASSSDRKEYDRIRALPDMPAKYDMLAGLNPAQNPNVKVVTGLRLIDIAGQGNYIPQFDENFEKTHKLTFMPAGAMAFYNKFSKILTR